MTSGPTLLAAQQWEPVVWKRAAPTGQAAKGTAAVNAARRQGTEVETSKKFSAASNRSSAAVVPKAKKLDENSETFRHKTVSHDLKLALQQARLAKKMSQADLATAINERSSVVSEYEAGKAIPNGAIINKLNNALGVRLPKAK
eukprot:gb/GFBE01016073.1/.p1 GENE.gb/GFBE01016073.1/~~gb/GFBE01016073.1/.p1  ORF type:complete len:144 (+),score=45.47 gb/GFBE01016073.1/:1-432(+)